MSSPIFSFVFQIVECSCVHWSMLVVLVRIVALVRVPSINPCCSFGYFSRCLLISSAFEMHCSLLVRVGSGLGGCIDFVLLLFSLLFVLRFPYCGFLCLLLHRSLCSSFCVSSLAVEADSSYAVLLFFFHSTRFDLGFSVNRGRFTPANPRRTESAVRFSE